MNDYKGIYFGDTTEQQFYEHGAHFKYSSLVSKLTELQEKLKPKTRTRNTQSSIFQSSTEAPGAARTFHSYTKKKDTMSQFIHTCNKNENLPTSKTKYINLSNRGTKDSKDLKKKKLISTNAPLSNNSRNRQIKDLITLNSLISCGIVKKNRHISLELNKKKGLSDNKTPNKRSTSKMTSVKSKIPEGIKIKNFNIIKDNSVKNPHNSVAKSKKNARSISKNTKSRNPDNLTQRTDKNNTIAKSIFSLKAKLNETKDPNNNYAQMYLKKNFFKGNLNKFIIEKGQISQRDNAHRKISPIMYKNI